MKQLTKKRWRELNVFNPHNLAAMGGKPMKRVVVYYRPQMTGRGYRSAAWQVMSLDIKTDPKGHWMDNGHKTFGVFRPEEKEPQLKAALAFAREEFGVEEWERSPWGSYHPMGTMENAARRCEAKS